MTHRTTTARVMTLAAAGITLVLALSGCNAGDKSDATEDQSSQYGFNESGLPIVDKTLTLRIAGEKASACPGLQRDGSRPAMSKTPTSQSTGTCCTGGLLREAQSPARVERSSGCLLQLEFTDEELVRYGGNGTFSPSKTSSTSTPPISRRSSRPAPSSRPRSPHPTGTSTPSRTPRN